MADSMIEKVATALADHYDDGLNTAGYIDAARAAIEAMRELNDVMADTACDIVVGWDDFATGDGNIYLGIPGHPQKAQEVWGHMIDAALNEQVAG